MRIYIGCLILTCSLMAAGCVRSDSPGHSSDEGGSRPVDAGGENQSDPSTGTSSEPHDRDDSAADTGNASDSGTPPSGGSDSSGAGSPDARAWLVRLGSRDVDEMRPALDHFAAQGDEAPEIYYAHLDDPSADVRRGAAFGLYGLFDPADPRMVDAMRQALDDEDASVRHIALEAFNRLPRDAFLAALSELAARLNVEKEPDPDLRAQIARMIGRRQTICEDALPALNEAVRNDPAYNVRAACLHAIYNVASTAEEALPAPTYALRNDEDPRLRRVAANRLGRYGAASAPAVDELVAALSDMGVPTRDPDEVQPRTDEPVCLAAADALVRIGQPAVEALLPQVKSEDRTMRLLSIRILGEIGADARAALDVLTEAAASSDPETSAAAKTAILKIQRPRRR